MPDPLAETNDGFITLFSPVAIQRPDAGHFLTFFRLPGQRFHRLERSHWLVSLFGPLLLVGLTMYYFCVMRSEASWPDVYDLMVFNSSLLSLQVVLPQVYHFVHFFKGCFLTFYSIDAISSVIIENNNLLKNMVCFSSF
jgi:hypothetical protein